MQRLYSAVWTGVVQLRKTKHYMSMELVWTTACERTMDCFIYHSNSKQTSLYVHVGGFRELIIPWHAEKRGVLARDIKPFLCSWRHLQGSGDWTTARRQPSDSVDDISTLFVENAHVMFTLKPLCFVHCSVQTSFLDLCCAVEISGLDGDIVDITDAAKTLLGIFVRFLIEKSFEDLHILLAKSFMKSNGWIVAAPSGQQ